MDKKPIIRAIEACVPTTQTELASRIGVTVQTVNSWVIGRRPVPLERAFDIEHATQGAVRAEELNPKAARFARVAQ